MYQAQADAMDWMSVEMERMRVVVVSRELGKSTNTCLMYLIKSVFKQIRMWNALYEILILVLDFYL